MSILLIITSPVIPSIVANPHVHMHGALQGGMLLPIVHTEKRLCMQPVVRLSFQSCAFEAEVRAVRSPRYLVASPTPLTCHCAQDALPGGCGQVPTSSFHYVLHVCHASGKNLRENKARKLAFRNNVSKCCHATPVVGGGSTAPITFVSARTVSCFDFLKLCRNGDFTLTKAVIKLSGGVDHSVWQCQDGLLGSGFGFWSIKIAKIGVTRLQQQALLASLIQGPQNSTPQFMETAILSCNRVWYKGPLLKASRLEKFVHGGGSHCWHALLRAGLLFVRYTASKLCTISLKVVCHWLRGLSHERKLRSLKTMPSCLLRISTRRCSAAFCP